MKEVTKKLEVLLILLIILSFVKIKTGNLVLFLICIGVSSIYFLTKLRSEIKRNDVVIASIFALLCSLDNIFIGVLVIPSYLASICILRGSTLRFYTYNNPKKNNLLYTVLFIFGVGGIQALVNILICSRTHPITITVKLEYICHALQAGISEEILFRMFMFAICMFLIKNHEITRGINIICYLIMIIPHVLLHFSTGFELGSLFYLSIVFGLPYSIMLRKQNLLSAVGAHVIVDLLRFIFLGI